MMERFEIQLLTDARVLQNRLNLRSEDQRIPEIGVEERLLSHSVSRQDQPSGMAAVRRRPSAMRPLVIERECEHAIEMVHAAKAMVLVQMRNDFSIAACLQAVPLAE